MIAGVMMSALFFNKYCVKAWIGLMWVGIETSGRILCITSRFIKHGKFRDQPSNNYPNTRALISV